MIGWFITCPRSLHSDAYPMKNWKGIPYWSRPEQQLKKGKRLSVMEETSSSHVTAGKMLEFPPVCKYACTVVMKHFSEQDV